MGIHGYNTFCRNPIQITTIPGLGLQFGADYDIHLKKSFYLTTGLYWSYRYTPFDCPVEGIHGTEYLKEHFLNVPLHAKWKFDIRLEKFGINLYLGPTFSVGMSSRSHFDLIVSAISVKGTYDYFKGAYKPLAGSGTGKLNNMIKDELDAIGLRYSRCEARLDCGIGFVLKENHELVTGCDIGLNNRLKIDMGNGEYLIISNLYMGYRYRFGKKTR